MKLNEHYTKLLGFQEPEVDEELTPEKLNSLNEKEEDNDEDNIAILNQKQEEEILAKI
jgi:hypothetical protein